MKQNMGSTDRAIRLILAGMLIALYFTSILSGILGIVLLIPAGVFVITTLIGICPLYVPFGISTCNKK